MVTKMRWLIEQMEGIKAELWEVYEQHHTQIMFNAIDLLDSSIGEMLCAVDEMEGGNDGY